MKNKKIIIGSRGSKLALIYAERARAELLKNSEIESIDIKSISTRQGKVWCLLKLLYYLPVTHDFF